MLRRLYITLACTLLAATPLLSQGRGGAAGGRGGQAQADTATIVTRSGTGFIIDFVEQDIRTVINAISDIAGLSIGTANIPTNQRTTLRLADPVTREELPAILQGIVERAGMRWVEENGVYYVDRMPTGRGATQNTQAVDPVAMQYVIIPLKHQNNVALAQVLTALFATTGGGRGGINLANLGNQTNQAARGGGRGGAAGGGGGRGGRGGGGGGDDPDPLTTASSVNPNYVDPSFSLAGGMTVNELRALLDEQQAQDVRRAAAAAAQGGDFQILTQGGQGGLAASIQALLGGGAAQALQAVQQVAGAQGTDPRFVPIEGTNQVIVRALPADMLMIQAVIGAVDLRPLQVLIEVSIVEVRRSSDLNVGVSSSGSYTKTGDTDPTATGSLPLPVTFGGARDFIMTLTGGQGTVDYNVALQALSTRGDVRVASLPVIMAQNNRQAQLIVGEQRPFVSTSQTTDNGTVNSTVQYRDIATNLLITPTINPDGYVNLDVNQQIQSVTGEVEFGPIIGSRQAITSLFVRSGQTAVVGGLSTGRTDKQRSGIPILSSIPIIGALFGSTSTSDEVSELYLFLTPWVVQTDQDTDFIRDAVRSNSELIKDIPLRQVIPQPDTTIRVIIPPDTALMTTIPRRVDTLATRIPPRQFN